MDEIASDFGSRLKELRKAAGLSQRKLAAEAGMHWNSLAKLERGLYEPSWPTVLLLAKVLNVSVEAFQGKANERGKK